MDIGIEQARKNLGELANRAQLAGETTYLTRNGKRIAAVVPLERIMPTYTSVIEASNEAGDIWQAVAPAESFTDEETDASEVAYWIASNQTVADGSKWRVRVWLGADADTATEPAAVCYGPDEAHTDLYHELPNNGWG